MLMTGICLVFLFGALGLVFDLGRAFITKNEAQAFTDSAALTAAMRLTGTSAGIEAAKAGVKGDANKWLMQTKKFSNVLTEFSTNRSNWFAAPGVATDIRYVRVTAPTNSVTLHFLSMVGAPKEMAVAARSVAGQQLPTSFPQGVFPFAPLAHGPASPNFGYTKGDELTLLWPASVGSNGQSVKLNNLCMADRNAAAVQAVKDGTNSERGYIMENSADAIREAIEDDHMDYTVSEGQAVDRASGVKNTDVKDSLADRVAQDSDPNTEDYDTYIANHDPSRPLRRVVIVPIISDAVTAKVLGFVKVFLPPSQPKNPNDSKCAMFIGPANTPTANTGSGSNMVRLFE
jgi:Flp pilus assembly protein TadG